MGEIKSTKDNLKAAIGGENYEFTKMYPDFMKQADAEGNNKAKGSFNLANEVEQIHHRLYQEALDMISYSSDRQQKYIKQADWQSFWISERDSPVCFRYSYAAK